MSAAGQLRDATNRLQAAGCPSAAVDARLLLAHVLASTPDRLALNPVVTPAQAAIFDAMVARRAAGEPVQYLTGTAYFRHETLGVGPGVFIPRPETEGLVQLVLDRLAMSRLSNPLVVDLGTGSGAIALALAHEAPGARVVAVERSDAALQFARRNLAGSGVELRAGDWREAVDDLAAAVDVVVSNPPYVPTAARQALPVDVVDPPEALFAGGDGLDALREIAPVAARLLRPGGYLACEHDDTHGASAAAVVEATGDFTDVADHRDLTGRARYVTAGRRP